MTPMGELLPTSPMTTYLSTPGMAKQSLISTTMKFIRGEVTILDGLLPGFFMTSEVDELDSLPRNVRRYAT